MSVESEILRIQHNIASAYAKVAEKGGEVPLQPTSAKLAAAVASIPAGGSSGGVPVGTIVIWSGTASNIPDGWALCDGQDGRPDLRDKFVLGAGTAHAVGDTGGEATHTLTVAEMPSHRHNVALSNQQYRWTDEYTNGPLPVATGTASLDTTAVGGSQPHNNMPPYYALCYIIKTAEDSGGANITAGDGLSKEGDTLSVTTPVRGIVTQAEFDALTEAQKNSGLYVISDGGGGGGSGEESAGEVYSTEETRIGTWIDGKPLYRKVYTWTGQYRIGPSRTYQPVGAVPSNMDQIVYCYGYHHISTPSDYTTIIPYADGGVGSFATFDVYAGSIDDITRWSSESTIDKIVAIFLYTKTTDEGGTT